MSSARRPPRDFNPKIFPVKEQNSSAKNRVKSIYSRNYKTTFQYDGICTLENAHGGGGRSVGPQVNKFEQVSSDHHQTSLAGGGDPSMTDEQMSVKTLPSRNFVCGL